MYSISGIIYTFSSLYYGLPIDFYVTVSPVYGGAVSLIYWWISHSKYKAFTLYFIGALPFYGLLRDFFGQRVSGTTFLVWDHPLWWMLILLHGPQGCGRPFSYFI
jgi:hypothetical protein